MEQLISIYDPIPHTSRRSKHYRDEPKYSLNDLRGFEKLGRIFVYLQKRMDLLEETRGSQDEEYLSVLDSQIELNEHMLKHFDRTHIHTIAWAGYLAKKRQNKY